MAIFDKHRSDNLTAQFTSITPQVATIPSADHNSIQDYTQYYQLLRDFFDGEQE